MDKRKKIFPINQLTNEAGLQEVKAFITAHNFFVLELDEKTRNNEILTRMADKASFYSRTYKINCFKHVAIVINGKGTKTFNDVFHRSSSDVDKRMLPHKEMKEVFDPKVYDFLQIIKKEFGDVQIRGMKEARTRVEQATSKGLFFLKKTIGEFGISGLFFCFENQCGISMLLLHEFISLLYIGQKLR